MTAAATVEAPPKAKAPGAKPVPSKAKAPVEQLVPDGIDVGDIVIFTPPQSATDTMRSLNGATVVQWPAIVTFVFPDRRHAALKCIRPFAAQDVVVRDAKYDADGAAGTFRAKPAKVSPQD
jgi:hypothetical protein